MNTFLPSRITEWNKLDLSILKSIALIYLKVDYYDLQDL